MLQLQATPKQSLYLGYLPFCDNLQLAKNFFNFNGQPQEEAGSAGGQPASNKADTYTVIMSSQLGAAHFYLLSVSYMASKNSYRHSTCFLSYHSFLILYTGYHHGSQPSE